MDAASMDPRKLVYFATVIEEGSVNKAARRLGISQPALSTSMDRLEKGLNCQLLDRSPSGVVATPIGEALYAHARLIRNELESAGRRLEGASSDEGDGVTFGTLPSLTASIIPAAVGLWRKDHPTLRLRLVEKNQIELLLSLLRGELDFIVAQTELYDFLEGMRQRVLFRDELLVIARPGHPALSMNQPGWVPLTMFPWVVQMMGKHRMLLEKLLAADSVPLPSQLTESQSVDFIRALVSTTDTLAMLPAAAVRRDVEEGRLVPLDIDEPLLHRDIAVLFRDGVKLGAESRELLGHIEAEGAARSRLPLNLEERKSEQPLLDSP